ncbi:shikimate kinase [Geovibrio thiophilus]|uniref:Shikimate kinase n=1 Tax=Geovibrio thiophilus TaxID=139438 RepID=A0A3R5Z0X5_9BACT|nr:shikimate kinase [Geovibrio thiophilus]QAR34280.1 shikimate kinase [Geovibrio thiophilus]
MRKNIYLIGFMGTGKSTVGRLVAQKLGMEFCDTDAMVEEKSGMTISQIFDEMDEDAFRGMETDVLKEITERKNLVVSTGGGIVVTRGNMELMRSAGSLITLMASPEQIFDRIKDDKGRPLLQVANPLDEIKQLIYDRAPFYINTDCIVETTELSPEDAAEEIIRFVENA